MKKQSLIKGTLILGVAGILAKFLGLFFRWPLIMLIGDEGVGYYQMSYPLYMFFVAIASGVPVAISKLVSEKNAIGDREGIFKVLKEALLLMGFMGIGTTAILYALSKPIISFLKWDPKAYYSLLGIAIAPMIISLMSAFRGFFQGLQNMSPTAVSQVIEQFGRVIFGVGLAYILLPRGIEFSAGGAALGAAAGGILAGIYLFIKYLKLKSDFNVFKVKSDEKILWKLMYIAIPISLGATVGTIMNLIDSILVPQKLLEAGFTYKDSTILYGQLTGKASVLVNLPLTLSMALCASLVPIIAEAYILSRKHEVVNRVDVAIKLSNTIAFPALAGLFFLSYPIMNLIFPGHSEGHNILRYLSLSIPFIIMAQTTTAILQGTGHYIRPVINLTIGCIIKILLTMFLVPIKEINIYGAVMASVVAYVIASLLNLGSLKRKLKVDIRYYDSIIKPAYCSIIMILVVLVIYKFAYGNTYSNGISCLISISSGIIIYILIIMITGIFKYSYIKKKLFKSSSKNN